MLSAGLTIVSYEESLTWIEAHKRLVVRVDVDSRAPMVWWSRERVRGNGHSSLGNGVADVALVLLQESLS